MAHVDGTGKRFVPSSRKYDRSIEDALQTMERLSAWIETAGQEDVWANTEDALQMAVLHGMLTHVRDAADQLLKLGGDEVAETVARVRGLHQGDAA